MKRIELMIVDDHPVVRAGLVALLSADREFEIVAEAASGRRARELIQNLEPDVVLLDLRMPDGDGLFVLEGLRQEPTKTRALVLTTYQDEAEFTRALEVGAAGYLLKDAPRAELCAAIRTVHAGGRVFTAALTKREERGPGPSPREHEVLMRVAQGMSNRQIAKELFISEATVKTHLGHLFDKLEARTRTEAVVAAHRRGWLTLSADLLG